MSELNTTEQKVYSVSLKADFYILADSAEHAEKIAEGLWPTSNIEIELPSTARPYYSAHTILNQGEDMRNRCVNL